MPKNGFYLKKLIIAGDNIQNATIDFELGLNVIYGPSDTGKSYIFQCIDYILGGNKEPKNIEESHGYYKLFLEIQSYNNDYYTIYRELGNNEFHVWKSAFSEIESNQYKVYSLKHSDTNEENISSFLLQLIGIQNFKIKKNQRGELQNLTITSIKRLILIDETKIISEIPVIHSTHRTQYTAEKSAIKTLVTGSDDFECESVEDPKIYKSRINGKIELIDELVAKLEEDLSIYSKKHKETNFTELYARIDKIESLIQINSKVLNDKTSQREELWNNLNKIESDLLIQNELISRFGLLKMNLETDINRLTFIQEGEHYLSQLSDSNCPVCNGEIDTDSNINLEEIQKSCNIEKKKIHLKLNDLKKTISSMKTYNDGLDTEINIIRQKIKNIDYDIADTIKPVIIINKRELDDLYKSKSIENEIEVLQNELHNLKAKKSILEDELSQTQKKSEYISFISDEEYNNIRTKTKSN